MFRQINRSCVSALKRLARIRWVDLVRRPADARTVKGRAAMARDLLYELRIETTETTVHRERCGELDRERMQALMVQDPSRRETEVCETNTNFQKSPTEHVSSLRILRDRIEKASG
ncbi:hypothetical protein [Burkholderia sp. JP2-270]|uniref:hypothetical protein n=1 Tax=Burkholderia sp. JP2-270 TaxID=2217913 RepID=UPI0013A6ACB4|nr:hypothetical protein [Burkholderia sp. JP2-270]